METFEATIVVNDGGGAWAEVPGEVIAALGGARRITKALEMRKPA